MADSVEPRGTIMLRTHAALHIAAGVFGLALVISLFRGDTTAIMLSAFLGFLCMAGSAVLALLSLLIVSQLGLFEAFSQGPPPPQVCTCPPEAEVVFNPEDDDDDDD